MTISLKPKAPICLSHPELNELAFTFGIPVIIEKIKICTIAGKKLHKRRSAKYKGSKLR